MVMKYKLKLKRIMGVYLCTILTVSLVQCQTNYNTIDVDEEESITREIVAFSDEYGIKIKVETDDNDNIVLNENGSTAVEIQNDSSSNRKDIFVRFILLDNEGKKIDDAFYTNWRCDANSSKILNITPFKEFPDTDYSVNIELTHIGTGNIAPPPVTTEFTDEELWSYAKYAVKEQLKSPSSAKFPFMSEANITKNSKEIIITSYVDADNSYGANIRSTFKVVLSADGNNVISIEID